MPEQGPREVIPHVLSAVAHYSDEPGLVTWIYPFEENHELVFGAKARPGEPFFGDWFMRGAVNAGLPLNTVVSTENFIRSRVANPAFYRHTILLAPVPAADSALEHALFDSVRSGHHVLLYGPATHASPAMLDLLGLTLAEPMAGELDLRHNFDGDYIRHGVLASRLNHRATPSGGGVDTVLRGGEGKVCATVSRDGTERVFALLREGVFGAGSGHLAWVRGSFSSSIGRGHLPVPDDPRKLFPSELLLRWMLARLGFEVRVSKPSVGTRNPVVLVARSNNGFFFSGYSASTVTTLSLKFPHGAPLLVGAETWLENGRATYSMPRAWHREARCFVQQRADGELSCVERYSGHVGIRRRIWVRGLRDATVHFYPELRPAAARVIMAANDLRPHNEQSIPCTTEDGGRRLVAHGVTGELLISW